MRLLFVFAAASNLSLILFRFPLRKNSEGELLRIALKTLEFSWINVGVGSRIGELASLLFSPL